MGIETWWRGQPALIPSLSTTKARVAQRVLPVNTRICPTRNQDRNIIMFEVEVIFSFSSILFLLKSVTSRRIADLSWKEYLISFETGPSTNLISSESNKSWSSSGSSS
mmetsp:Transcript_6387/g.12751  ORF Transcript_6387/g.12751 Transcript_6387/m.12751 type:complete len:108 (+) Transcript_6387:1396-1719(+)